MTKPTLHVIAPFHTLMNSDYHHCAFTQKAFRIPKMMQPLGYRVVEYSNGDSESEAQVKVMILTKEELELSAGKHEGAQFHGNSAVLGTPHWIKFDNRLKEELRKHVAPGDIICHPFGRSHADVVKLFPDQHHVETGIGYPDSDFGAFRIFESYAWMHYHLGKKLHFDGNGRVCYNSDQLPIVGEGGKDYMWVVPNYFDLEDWPYRAEKGEYFLYYGRICSEKGLDTLKVIADYIDEEIHLVGQGDATPWKHKRIKYRGPVTGRARADVVGRAKALLMPTRYIEPFGGAGVEGQLCGAPLLASSYGCFSETIDHGVTGYRCHTLGDWLDAIKMVNQGKLSRKVTSERAQRLYSMETCAKRYDAIFQQISDLRRGGSDPEGSGWYHIRGHMVHQ
jgi:glycosyltransferase involved in cell wall biosynthesis